MANRSGKIIVITTEGGKNPRKPGTYGFRSWLKITPPQMAYDDYIKAGGRKQDVEWDAARGWVTFTDANGVVVTAPAAETAPADTTTATVTEGDVVAPAATDEIAAQAETLAAEVDAKLAETAPVEQDVRPATEPVAEAKPLSKKAQRRAAAAAALAAAQQVA